MRSLKTQLVLTLSILLFLNLSPALGDELYHLVSVPNPSSAAMQVMAELGLPMDDAQYTKGENLEIPLEVQEIALLESRGISYEIVIEDLEAYYGEICRNNVEMIPFMQTDDDPVHMKYGSMGGYYNWQEMVADLDSMNLLYPEICAQKVILGYGWDENPIYMVKISDNVEIHENEPEGIFDGTHHAREPGAYTAIIYAMWYLLENYGTDEEATYLIDNREIYFVPIANPDGFLYNQLTNPNGGGMWRKNRRNNGTSYGVDLNRNYTYQWGYDNSGSSPTPSSSTYRGPSAGSEPETQALMNFINEHDFRTGMTIHSNSGVYITAYGYDSVPPENPDIHMEYMAYAAAENGYGYGFCNNVMYDSNGRTQDWQLHEHGIINIEPEIGSSSFWPPIYEIMPTSEEQLRISLHLYWCAGGKVEYTASEVEDGYLNPGAEENLLVTVFNVGMGTAEPVDFEVSTIDPYITLLNSTASTDTIIARGSENATFALTVDEECPIGHTVEFTVTIDQAGFVRTQDFSMIVGQPEILFEDDAESGMGNWTSSGGWGASNLSSHSGTFSFTESPYGNYSNNLTAYMTLTNPLNLTAANTLWLEFWAEWDIESNYDFAQVEVSTDGNSWTPVAGLYTVPGSGIGVQISGQPGYEGTQPNYVREHIDLNTYVGQPYFKFRFEFKSDGGVYGDGFNVDDIKLMGFTGPFTPPEVTITLVPVITPIIIPAGGGNFDYTITVSNNEASAQVFDVWLDVVIPGGTVYGPIIYRPGLTVPAGGNIIRTMTQVIPAGAPEGGYHFQGHTGLYPNLIYYEDGFDFSKEGE